MYLFLFFLFFCFFVIKNIDVLILKKLFTFYIDNYRIIGTKKKYIQLFNYCFGNLPKFFAFILESLT